MDFIERCFGLTPDGGSGWLEAMLVTGLLLAALAVSRLVRRGRSPRTDPA